MWPASLLLAAALWAAPVAAQAPENADPAPRAIPAYGGHAELTVKATAYTSGPESTGKRPGHPQYGITFTGVRAQQGRTIAVDPRQIPLGSMVYIHELGETRIAEDTGSAISGKRIDIYMESLTDALNWGVRPVRVDVYPPI